MAPTSLGRGFGATFDRAWHEPYPSHPDAGQGCSAISEHDTELTGSSPASAFEKLRRDKISTLYGRYVRGLDRLRLAIWRVPSVPPIEREFHGFNHLLWRLRTCFPLRYPSEFCYAFGAGGGTLRTTHLRGARANPRNGRVERRGGVSALS